MLGMTAVNEWLCPAHQGYAKSKADRWWLSHGGQRPFPKSPMEWLTRQNELLSTAEILVEPNGRYWNVKGHKPGGERVEAEAEVERAEEKPVDWGAEIDDFIPF